MVLITFPGTQSPKLNVRVPPSQAPPSFSSSFSEDLSVSAEFHMRGTQDISPARFTLRSHHHHRNSGSPRVHVSRTDTRKPKLSHNLPAPRSFRYTGRLLPTFLVSAPALPPPTPQGRRGTQERRCQEPAGWGATAHVFGDTHTLRREGNVPPRFVLETSLDTAENNYYNSS